MYRYSVLDVDYNKITVSKKQTINVGVTIVKSYTYLV